MILLSRTMRVLQRWRVTSLQASTGATGMGLYPPVYEMKVNLQLVFEPTMNAIKPTRTSDISLRTYISCFGEN